MGNFLSTTLLRLKSPSPEYFIHIRWWASFIGVILGAIEGGLLAVPTIPSWITITLGIIVAVLGAIAGFTFLTTSNAALSKK